MLRVVNDPNDLDLSTAGIWSLPLTLLTHDDMWARASHHCYSGTSQTIFKNSLFFFTNTSSIFRTTGIENSQRVSVHPDFFNQSNFRKTSTQGFLLLPLLPPKPARYLCHRYSRLGWHGQPSSLQLSCISGSVSKHPKSSHWEYRLWWL